MEDVQVVDQLRVSIVAAVSAAEVVDWWVEDHLLKYVVVVGVPEGNWATSGWEGVRRDNPSVAWGQQGLLVVSKVWQKLAVRLEVLNVVAVVAVVKSAVVVGARRFGAQLAIAAGSRGVPRGPAPAKGAPLLGSLGLVVWCVMAAG